MNPLLADLEQDISRLGIKTALIAGAIMVGVSLLAVLLKKQKSLKLPLFVILALTLIGSTGVLFGSTIYLNMKSESGGPVHWHTDIEFWVCGSELELRDPQGVLSNKIGTSSFHEHNDKRIHLEGVVVRKKTDASLTKFMQVIGGYMADDRIAIPLNDEGMYATADNNKIDGDKQDAENYATAQSSEGEGLALGGPFEMQKTEDGLPLYVLNNGQTCNNSKTDAELQVFVYTFDKASKTYSQRKLDQPTDYVMREEPIVPPGDCVIVEFNAPKDRTDKLCREYGIRDAKRCVEFGVKAYDPNLCNISEVGR